MYGTHHAPKLHCSSKKSNFFHQVPLDGEAASHSAQVRQYMKTKWESEPSQASQSISVKLQGRAHPGLAPEYCNKPKQKSGKLTSEML